MRVKPIEKTDKRLAYNDAVFQYLIDHGVFTGKKWKVEVYFLDQKDFEWRVSARKMGIRRNDADEARREANEFLKMKSDVEWNRKENLRFQNRAEFIQRHGSLFQKAILFLYKATRDYLKKPLEFKEIK